jgi:hypothetical protein
MTSNEIFISQTEEYLAKIGSAKAPQFNPDNGSFRELSDIKENEIIPLSFARSILCAQASYIKNCMNVKILLMYRRSQSRLNTEVSK